MSQADWNNGFIVGVIAGDTPGSSGGSSGGKTLYGFAVTIQAPKFATFSSTNIWPTFTLNIATPIHLTLTKIN